MEVEAPSTSLTICHSHNLSHLSLGLGYRLWKVQNKSINYPLGLCGPNMANVETIKMFQGKGNAPSADESLGWGPVLGPLTCRLRIDSTSQEAAFSHLQQSPIDWEELVYNNVSCEFGQECLLRASYNCLMCLFFFPFLNPAH